ncbi:hypothetical protein Pint_20126 [Pistacia integerrima]|uniref:Uncharacterized protein n=1 Tax=Pistacia integerrima TaxID=434235 RepID=A0ACC0XA57_9ROSI|nr:hypothetical protein Pint_20126 [Pistacia integerrima]
MRNPSSGTRTPCCSKRQEFTCFTFFIDE